MIGPFEVGDRLGIGGMGVVYRAVYTKTGTPCAIKVLSPDVSDSPSIQQRFEREIAILKKLQHPHIVKYYGGGKIGSQRFYAMEFVAGGSLEDLLLKKGKIPWEDALNYANQVALALEHAHTAGVIHRDLKPANLLVDGNNQIKLTDFGIARDTTATALTAAGKTVGTYAYMAPEQIRGKPPVDRKTDLYALGCVLFEMLTGETPFQSENQGELLMMHLQQDAPRVTSLVPQIPIWVEELVFQLLEKEPDDRPFDALAVQTQIEEIWKKVEDQKSVVQETLSSGVTVGMSASQTRELKGILKKKKKRKTEEVPFYERLWFLATALVILLLGVGWLMLPPSEDSLMASAIPLMEAEDPTGWLTARDRYLQPLVERFPNGKQADKARDYLDQIEMHLAEKRARNNARLGKDPGSEAERLFMEADRYDRFGDRVTSLEKYRSMVELLKDRKEDRPYVQLARQKVRSIEQEGGSLDRVAIVNSNLKKAEELLAQGKTVEARAIWESIKSLYRDNQELHLQVQRAIDRLAGKEPTTPLEPAADPEKSGPKEPAPEGDASSKPPAESNK